MAEKEIPGGTINIPVGQSISADGTEERIILSLSTNNEAAERSLKLHEQQGYRLLESGRIEKGKKIEEAINKVSKSYGFTRWNSSWNPKGPKPNWAKPENASNN